MTLPLGAVIADVEGLLLTAADRRRLMHPQLGGVILFSRHYESVTQLCALTAEIRALRGEGFVIAVDHEGGRVQRFREGFTILPAMRKLGTLWDADEDAALKAAKDCGYVLASELRACGVNLSFTPVLDLDYGESGVIGDRAFHRDPHIVAALAAALQRGLSEGGLASCGKHFPGHGYIRADSHHEVPVDERDYAAIESEDMLPYKQLIPAGLTSVMPAHVIYPKVDAQPAGFSRKWLQEILRGAYRFEGLIFSDDLSMEGASVAGGYDARAVAALEAGCDMVLVCNDLENADKVLAGLAEKRTLPVAAARLERLAKPAPAGSRAELNGLARYRAACETVAALG
jgi:beta-N-acetylhexosaminidase